MCCWFNHHFALLVHLPSSLWCIFSHVFPSKPHVSIGFQGAHSFHLPFVRTIHAPSLACYACYTLSTNKDISFASTCNHSQGDTIPPIAGTPTPNGLRSSWEFLLGRSPDMLVGPTLSTFIVLEGWPYEKLHPLILFLIFSHSSQILSKSLLKDKVPYDFGSTP